MNKRELFFKNDDKMRRKDDGFVYFGPETFYSGVGILGVF